MEAYDQRYDVAVCSTVEWPEFLLYVILFGVIVKKTLILFLRLGLWADALHGSTRLIFFLQYIHPYIYNK